MRILDRYVARKFLGSLVFALFAFAMILIVIDAVERLSEYIDKGAPARVIFLYYVYYLPYILVLSMPIAMLLASMFSVGHLARFQEILAMKASGISVLRILAPIFTIGLIISISMIFFAETVMPWANSEKAEIKRKYIDRDARRGPTQIANLFFQDKKDRKIFIGYYNTFENSAREVHIIENAGNEIKYRLDADLMTWEDHQWVLANAYEREFSNGKEVGRAYKGYVLKDLDLGPAQLSRAQKNPEEMSFQEMQLFIQQVRRNGGDPNRWLVDLYLKIAFPFANLIIVLFGAPLAASRVRSTGAVGVAVSMTVCFLYFGAIKIGQTLGQTGALNPMIAAWLGNIIFSAGSLVIIARAPK